MAKQLRVTLERGPKGKKFAALAPDWPGLERGGKTGDAAVEALVSYLPRYAAVARLAGLADEFSAAAAAEVRVVEEYEGAGSTDFWGISFAFSSIDRQDMSRADLEREIGVMEACWARFDEVRGRVSAGMAKGPRGGGRDRDRIIHHVLRVEQDWGKKVGLRPPPDDEVVIDTAELGEWRSAYCSAIRTFHADGKMARNWPLRYLIRHTAYHAMDHAWEMEDKDLSGSGG